MSSVITDKFLSISDGNIVVRSINNHFYLNRLNKLLVFIMK